MNYKALIILNREDELQLESFINAHNEISISLAEYGDPDNCKIISINKDNAIAFRDELNIMIKEL